MDAPFVSDLDFHTISPPERRPFWRVLETFWEDFWNYFGMFRGYRFDYDFLYDFKMILNGL